MRPGRAAVILETVVTTVGPDGTPNIAPMGPVVKDDDLELSRFCLRPFQSSTTFRNLKATGEGVLHVVDDVLLLARAAIGRLEPADVPTRPAERVAGIVLTGACRYCEFRVVTLEDQEERAMIYAETVHRGRLRDFFGFNRAKHAVLEAAILATRVGLIPAGDILAEFDRLAVPVGKTAGPREREAFDLLRQFVAGGGDA
jgi:hypothetical protein